MTLPYRKKLIEVGLPLVAINAESARENSIRRGPLNTCEPDSGATSHNNERAALLTLSEEPA